jgi:hypothetical protein
VFYELKLQNMVVVTDYLAHLVVVEKFIITRSKALICAQDGEKGVVRMPGIRNLSNRLSGLAEVEQDNCFTDASGDEIVFRCCERLPTLLVSKNWQEIGYTLTAVSEALLKRENR